MAFRPSIGNPKMPTKVRSPKMAIPGASTVDATDGGVGPESSS